MLTFASAIGAVRPLSAIRPPPLKGFQGALRTLAPVMFVLAIVMMAPWMPQAEAASQPVVMSAPLSQTLPTAQILPTAQTVPTAQAYTLPPEKLAKAVALSRIRNILYFVSTLWGLAVLWILLASVWSSHLAGWLERRVGRRWMQGLLFFAALLAITALADLPLGAVGQAVSQHYGISVQSWPSWLGDQGKGLGVTLLLGAPVLLLFHWIVRRWPRRYWLGVWLATLPLMVLSIFGEPLLAPLFNKFEPLMKSNPALVVELDKVVARTGTNIPVERMFLMKASEKTNGLNAYVSGIGATKRIVVWDTTAGRIANDEVLFIFGHESGHYVLNHIPKLLIGSAAGLFFVFWISAALAGWLVQRFGARWHVDSLATRPGMVVLLMSLSMVSFLVTPVNSGFSRYFEHEADVYGQESIHGIVADPQKTAVASFNHLGEAWLEDPAPNPFIEFWLFSHPSVGSRAQFARQYNPWANGGHGRFFDR